jgi:hypothetical protein
MVEVILSAGITSLVLLAGVSTFLMAMSSWFQGQGTIDAQSGSQLAVRTISKELREAMAVLADEDGLGLSYRLPLVDGDGDYVMPIEWDGIDRRIQLEGADLVIREDDARRVLCSGVVLADSQAGGQAYRIFTPGAGAVTRSLTVMVVTRKNAQGDTYAASRSRETIFLRNIPELAR